MEIPRQQSSPTAGRPTLLNESVRNMPRRTARLRAYADRQNALHRELTRFVNGGFASRRRAAAAAMGFQAAWRAEAGPISEAFRRLVGMNLPGVAPAECIRIEPYRGGPPEIIALQDDVARHLRDDLLLCLVHGSVATGETVPYSDVDALVVLKDDVMKSHRRLARAARALSRARSRMYAFDALQHHGWFVLTERDLSCHCEAHFPGILFRYARLLIPESVMEIRLATRDSRREILEAFDDLANLVQQRIESGSAPRDLYDLKALLSQLMLLPTLYLQVRDGRGVWKGRSFELARVDFSRSAWRSMETASSIRAKWPQLRGAWLPRLHGPVVQKFARRLAPEIPRSVDVQLTDAFYGNALALIEEMKGKVDEVRICDRNGPLRNYVSG